MIWRNQKRTEILFNPAYILIYRKTTHFRIGIRMAVRESEMNVCVSARALLRITVSYANRKQEDEQNDNK